jgi:hypothetical protein
MYFQDPLMLADTPSHIWDSYAKVKRPYVRPSPELLQKYTEFLYIGTLPVDTHSHSYIP